MPQLFSFYYYSLNVAVYTRGRRNFILFSARKNDDFSVFGLLFFGPKIVDIFSVLFYFSA